jgi:hypothetical protein
VEWGMKTYKNEFLDMYKNVQMTMPQNDLFIIIGEEEASIIQLEDGNNVKSAATLFA